MTQALDKAALLLQHEFFRDMPPSAIARFSARSRILSFASGDRIFSKGDEGHGLVAIISGLVRISVPSDGRIELTLNLIGANEVLGEISLLDGQPRTADATAMTPCRVLLLERREFTSILEQEPAAALALLKVLSRRLRATSQQLEQASFGPKSSRLAQALLSLAAAMNPGEPRLAAITMPQHQIGNMIGLSRESTNRYLRAWDRAGVIELRRGGLGIRDWDALSKLAGP